MNQQILGLSSVALLCAMTAGASADDASFDLGFEFTAASDYMDTGLTNSDHDPSFSMKFSPSYGIFYGEIYGATIDYGVPEPKLETKLAIGATPQFGNLSVDFNLARRMKFDDASADRWLPYVTATYTFSDAFNASAGAGYYYYDDKAVHDFWELYLGATYSHASGSSLAGEFYWEPDSDGADNHYYELIGTLTVPFMEKFEAVAKLGYEGYEDPAVASYLWYEARLNYSITNHLVLSAVYHGNNLSNGDCPTQAWTDCDSALFAVLTVKGSLSDLR